VSGLEALDTGGTVLDHFDFFNGGSTGRVRGYREEGWFQVRLKRDPNATEKPEATKSFLEVRTVSSDTTESTITCTVRTLTMNANSMNSAVLTVVASQDKESVYLVPFDVEKASLGEGQFIINIPDIFSGDKGTLDLVFKRQGEGEVIARTIQNQMPGKVTIALDDILTGTSGTPVKPFDNQDAAKFDKIYARWRIKTVDAKTGDKAFDDLQINNKTVKVAVVEVLARRKISNYFSPEWNGVWSGAALTKGAYQSGQFPASLANVNVAIKLLNALDPANEGLAMNGNTVIRDRYRPAQAGFPQVTAINGGTIPNDADSQYYDVGYIGFFGDWRVIRGRV